MDGFTAAADNSSGPGRRGPGPRLYHKKSRTGCYRCKARRVKCDEQRPVCGGCSRHSVECVYPPTAGDAAHTGAAAAAAGMAAAARSAAAGSSAPSGRPVMRRSSQPGLLSSASSLTAPSVEQQQQQQQQQQQHYYHGTPEDVVMSQPGCLGAGAASGPSSSLSSAAAATPYPGPPEAGGPSHGPQRQQAATAAELHARLLDALGPQAVPEQMPESRDRRVMELRLMHNYMLELAQQYNRTEGQHGPQPPPRHMQTNQELREQQRQQQQQQQEQQQQEQQQQEQQQQEEGPSSPAASTPGASSSPSPPTSGGAAAAGAAQEEEPPAPFKWGRDVPLMAFEDDSILYTMFAHSALSMWAASGDAAERTALRLLQQQYLALALREQRRAVGRLGPGNADHVCISSLLLLNHSFALVQTVPTSPWEPPLEWLRIGRGTGTVFQVARGYLTAGGPGPGGGGSSRGHRISAYIDSPPRFDPDDMFTPETRAHLLWLLDNDGGSTGGVGDHDLDDKATRAVYHRVLSYVGACQRAAAAGEPVYAVCRRLAAFAVWAPEPYAGFLAQRRPRALVALAHFFALWIRYAGVWVVGTTGERQVRGIREALDPRWRHKLDPIFEEHGLER